MGLVLSGFLSFHFLYGAKGLKSSSCENGQGSRVKTNAVFPNCKLSQRARCASSETTLCQDSAYAVEPLCTMGLPRAALQYSLQDMTDVIHPMSFEVVVIG